MKQQLLLQQPAPTVGTVAVEVAIAEFVVVVVELSVFVMLLAVCFAAVVALEYSSVSHAVAVIALTGAVDWLRQYWFAVAY